MFIRGSVKSKTIHLPEELSSAEQAIVRFHEIIDILKTEGIVVKKRGIGLVVFDNGTTLYIAEE